MTETLLAVSTPVFEVEDQVVGDLSRDIVRLEVEEATDGLRRLSARFQAVGPVAGSEVEGELYLDGADLDFGKLLVVSIGPPGEERTIFRGRISGLEAEYQEGQATEVVVFAEDALMDLRMTRRSRTYENMDDAGIAEEIAGEHGLSTSVDAPGPTYPVVQQMNLSDLAFLRERARLIQAEVWVADDTLHFKSRGARTGTELALVRGNDVLALSLRADLAHQRTTVRVSGYDASAREVIDEEAGEDVVAAEVSIGRTGPAVLATALGDRESLRVREVPTTGEEAVAWAESEMLRRARAFVTASGVTDGTPDLVIGSILALENVAEPFAGGGYYVTSVRHTFDTGSGHRTYFTAERATLEGGG